MGTGGTRTASIEIRTFEPEDEDRVIELWHTCGLTRSWNDPALDVARKRSVADDLFLVAGIGETATDRMVVGTLMAGYDGHRGSINYVAVLPVHRRLGVGRALMAEAERRLIERGCPKINLQVRNENPGAVEFYRSLGYEAFEVVDMGKRLIPDGQIAQ